MLTHNKGTSLPKMPLQKRNIQPEGGGGWGAFFHTSSKLSLKLHYYNFKISFSINFNYVKN